ncbi:hypothetical protein HY439_03185 [Candidatus Microgenomates bacterium]|nr:hypothetical protein [Candidatus Microgenomates bacterium]
MVMVVEAANPRLKERGGLILKEPANLAYLNEAIDGLQNFIGWDGRIKASTIDGQYPADFGRDTATFILLCSEAMAAFPFARYKIAPLLPAFKESLRFLAKHQGQRDDPLTGERKGKIPHEIRFGPENQIKLKELKAHRWPVKGDEENLSMVNYYNIEATALWLIALNRFCEVTEDSDLLKDLHPQIENACEYLLNKEHPETGLVLFQGRSSEVGLTHQNWKDSGDSAPPAPIYYTEVQGYYYQANLVAAKILKNEDPESKLANELLERADKLKKSFNKYFYWPEQGYYYQALLPGENGGFIPVREVTSNPGHCLYLGIIQDEEKKKSLAERLVQEDMLSTTGIRTLSSDSSCFNLKRYQIGTSWPHDNAMCVLGLRKMGHHKKANTVSCRNLDILLRLGSAYEFTIAGEDGSAWMAEELAKVKTPPNKNQAWTQAAMVYLLATTPSYKFEQDELEEAFSQWEKVAA